MHRNATGMVWAWLGGDAVSDFKYVYNFFVFVYDTSYNEGHKQKSAFASPFSGQIASGMVGSS